MPTGEEVDQILANVKNGVKFGLDRAKVTGTNTDDEIIIGSRHILGLPLISQPLSRLTALVKILSRHTELHREASRSGA